MDPLAGIERPHRDSAILLSPSLRSVTVSLRSTDGWEVVLPRSSPLPRVSRPAFCFSVALIDGNSCLFGIDAPSLGVTVPWRF